MKQPSQRSLKKILAVLGGALVIALFLIGFTQIIPFNQIATETKTVAVKAVDSQILADGAVTSENEAVLHFQTAGKLVYLPVKEGDNVAAGQTIAQLDTYALQRELTQALNTYQSTRDTFDQSQENSQTGVLQGQQKYGLDVTNKSGISGQNETDVINGMVARILDQNQTDLNSSVINVELANYALQLASLTSPISGVITHEDVTSAGVNVTPLTTFTVDDPKQLVFRANVLENDIDFVAVDQPVTIKMASGKTYQGTVTKIYPQKITLASGDKAYQVDVTSTQLTAGTALGENGSVLIQSTAGQGVMLVPTWTVIGQKYIWV